MSYSDFGIEDFIKDPYFQAWVLQDDAEANSFWELWMELYPEKEPIVSAAIEILLNKSIESTLPLSKKDVKRAWKQLDLSIKQQNSLLHNHPSEFKIKKQRRLWMPMAAAVTGLLMFAFGFWFYRNQNATVTFTSRNSQVIPVSLPDGSQVMLNANSSLTFKKNWDDKKEREVWLKGEAFFSITKKPSKGLPTFTVHANKVNVQVLGTEFNVADRGPKTQVILSSGKIKLFVPTAGKPMNLTMVPGDYVAFVKNEKKLIHTKVNPEAFSGWRNRKLVFQNTPLAEIMGQIEQTYGVKVELSDSSLLDRTFTGTFPNNDLPILLNTLMRAFQVEIDQKGQTISVNKAANANQSIN
jgi:transmembrane sensor